MFPLTLWKNRVGKSEILFSFFFLFYFQFKWIHCNSNTIMRLFIELNKGFISCILEPLYTCRTAHIFAVVANTKMFLYFWNKLFFFLRGSLKFLGSGLKFRVGRVNRNTTFFLYGLICWNAQLVHKNWYRITFILYLLSRDPGNVKTNDTAL
jgi:hypothetical protein